MNTGLTAGVVYYVSAYAYAAGSFTLSTTAAYALAATTAASTGHVDTSSAGVAPVVATNFVIVPKYSSSAVGDISISTWADTGLQGGTVYAADAVWLATLSSAGSPTGALRVEVVLEPTYT